MSPVRALCLGEFWAERLCYRANVLSTDCLRSHGRHEGANDLLPGCGARIGELAGVFLRVSRHNLEIVLADAKLREAGRNAEKSRKLANGLDMAWMPLAPASRSERPVTSWPSAGDVPVALWACDQVEVADRRKQDRIADAMRQAGETAELMRHGVHLAEAGVVEGHAGKVFGICHAVAGFHVPAIGYGRGKKVADEFDGSWSVIQWPWALDMCGSRGITVGMERVT
jgi:hypothetical protein